MGTSLLWQTDTQLHDAVRRQLDWEPEFNAHAIAVTASDGVIALTGFVNSYAEKLAAEQTVKRVRGVRGVANDIQVKPGDERTDPEIATDAVHALQANVSVPNQITVTVRSGFLTLEGTVEWTYQKTAAGSACVPEGRQGCLEPDSRQPGGFERVSKLQNPGPSHSCENGVCMSKFKNVVVWLAGFGFVTALGALSAGSLAAQSPSAAPAAPHQHQATPPPPASTTKQEPGSTAMGQDMASMREKMMADQKTATTRLLPLIETMNAAKGEAKVDAIAAVLTELVHQRSAQMDHMSGMMMPDGMMGDDSDTGDERDMRKLAAHAR